MQRLIDAVLALVLIACLAPLGLLAALAVGVGLGRPLIFAQYRSGRAGRPFRLLKFRSMHPPGPRQSDDAARTPPLGRWLRRTRIDELPQLINILRGDMAFVGPRPLLPQTVAGFGEEGRCRGSVRPGLTGWAQVNGNTRLTDRQKLALDLWYIEHRSLWRDVILLAKTFAVVLFGEKPDDAALERAHAGNRRRRG